MAGASSSRFVLTPHKLVMCVLLNAVGAPRTNSGEPATLSSFSRQRLAHLLLQFFNAPGTLVEPSYEELEQNLLDSSLDPGSVFSQELRNLLLSISSVDDLFNLFLSLRDLLAAGQQHSAAALSVNGGGDQLMVELSSTLGMFLRRCILSFNELSFEGTCRLLRDLQSYCESVALAAAVAGESPVPPESSLTRHFQEHQFLDGEGEHQIEDVATGSHSRRRRQRDGAVLQEDVYGGRGQRQKSHVEEEEEDEEEDGDEEDVEEEEEDEDEDEDEEDDDDDDDDDEDGDDDDIEAEDGPDELPSMGIFDLSVAKDNTTKRRYFLRTPGEVEAYLSEQAVMVEKSRSFARVFTDGSVAKLSELKDIAFNIPQVHSLQYLNYLFQKDYPAAMESLHRFFDFSAGGEVSSSLHGSGSSHSHGDSGNGRLQAGLLGLGQMHSHMGHITMALQALNESILIAQQNNDNSCLLHALAALCNLFSEGGICTDDQERYKWITHPGLDPEHRSYPAPEQHILGLLKRCLRRALELKLPQLIGFSRLAIAKIKLQHVHKVSVVARMRNSSQFGTSPVEVCRILRMNSSLLGNFESSMFRMNSGIGGGGSSTHGRTAAHSDLTTNAGGGGAGISGSLGATGWGWWKPNGKLGVLARSLLQLGGTSQLLRAAAWEHYGSEPLVRASLLTHVACYADAASEDDQSLAYMKLVKLMTSLRGHSASQKALAMVAKRFPLLSKSRVRVVQIESRIEVALLQGEFDLARIACGKLLALASVVPGVDMALKTRASSYKVQVHLAMCQYKEAAAAAHKLFALCFKANMQQDSIEALLLIAEIHKKAGNAVTGLPYVLAALTLCQSLNLDVLQASAMVTLAELWMGLGIFPGRRALVLLHQCMPVVLGHGSLQLRARANLATAQCYLSDPDFSVVADHDAVLPSLEEAVQQARTVGDTSLAMECSYLQALVLDALGRVSERDVAATAFQGYMLATQMAHPAKLDTRAAA